jgi:hypothetical protein
MIKANELRFGNFVSNVDGKTMPITTIEKDGVTLFRFYLNQTDKHPDKTAIISDVISFDKIEPIPLTEEWLIKCGFNVVDKDLFAMGIICINRCKGEFDVFIANYDPWFPFAILPQIKYVHQLQNLYWCLVGVELTIKI